MELATFAGYALLGLDPTKALVYQAGVVVTMTQLDTQTAVRQAVVVAVSGPAASQGAVLNQSVVVVGFPSTGFRTRVVSWT